MSAAFEYDTGLVRVCCNSIGRMTHVYRSQDLIDHVRRYGGIGTDEYIKKHIEKALEILGFTKRNSDEPVSVH